MGLSGWEVSLSQGLITNINFTSTDLCICAKRDKVEQIFLSDKTVNVIAVHPNPNPVVQT